MFTVNLMNPTLLSLEKLKQAAAGWMWTLGTPTSKYGLCYETSHHQSVTSDISGGYKFQFVFFWLHNLMLNHIVIKWPMCKHEPVMFKNTRIAQVKIIWLKVEFTLPCWWVRRWHCAGGGQGWTRRGNVTTHQSLGPRLRHLSATPKENVIAADFRRRL